MSHVYFNDFAWAGWFHIKCQRTSATGSHPICQTIHQDRSTHPPGWVSMTFIQWKQTRNVLFSYRVTYLALPWVLRTDTFFKKNRSASGCSIVNDKSCCTTNEHTLIFKSPMDQSAAAAAPGELQLYGWGLLHSVRELFSRWLHLLVHACVFHVGLLQFLNDQVVPILSFLLMVKPQKEVKHKSASPLLLHLETWLVLPGFITHTCSFTRLYVFSPRDLVGYVTNGPELRRTGKASAEGWWSAPDEAETIGDATQMV